VKGEFVEGLTPVGRPLMVTLTVPVNPLVGFTVTVIGTLVVVCAARRELGETEIVKLGGGGGGGAAPPPPHPTLSKSRSKHNPGILRSWSAFIDAPRQEYSTKKLQPRLRSLIGFGP
jgi:hypothetical protein